MMNKQNVLRFHALSIQKYGGSLGIRDEGFLDSAIERPNASFAGEELYPTPFHKAAAILESIVKNHPFVDGNKRTGFLACAAMLLYFDYELIASEEATYEFVIKVASSHMEFDDIVDWLEINAIKI